MVGSILCGVDPLSYVSFQPVLHDWCNKGCCMCYPVYIKEPLLLIEKSSPCGGSGFPFYQNGDCTVSVTVSRYADIVLVGQLHADMIG